MLQCYVGLLIAAVCSLSVGVAFVQHTTRPSVIGVWSGWKVRPHVSCVAGKHDRTRQFSKSPDCNGSKDVGKRNRGEMQNCQKKNLRFFEKRFSIAPAFVPLALGDVIPTERKTSRLLEPSRSTLPTRASTWERDSHFLASSSRGLPSPSANHCSMRTCVIDGPEVRLGPSSK